MDRSDEGGDPACWAHLFDDESGVVDDGRDDAPASEEDGKSSPEKR